VRDRRSDDGIRVMAPWIRNPWVAAGALVQGERVLTGVALKGTVAQAAEKVAAKYGTVTTSAIKGAIDGVAGGMTSAFVLDITNAHLWDKGLYEGMARVVADTFTGALYGMSGGLLAGGGTAAAMKGGRVIASVGASAEEGLGSVASMRERTQPHPEAARITEALHDALPMHIREEMLAAVDVHVLESGPEADAFLATTGSHSGEACIWTDGEQIVVFARPEATVEDICCVARPESPLVALPLARRRQVRPQRSRRVSSPASGLLPTPRTPS